MNKLISRLMLASATAALTTATMPVTANAVTLPPLIVNNGTYELPSGSVFSASSLTVDGTGNPGVIVDSGATLNDDAIVGDASFGTFVNNGSHNVSGNLILGNQSTGVGTYTITGDSAQTQVNFVSGGNGAGNPNGALIVGNAGSGAFVQGGDPSEVTGPAVSVAGDLTLGHQSGSVGTYTLNLGALTVGGQLAVGGQSTGANLFTQNGGTVTLTGTANGNLDYASVSPGFAPFGSVLAVGGGIGTGDGSNSGGTGTYTITNGILDATNNGIQVGGTGTGIMNQSGSSTVNTGVFTLGFSGNGTYNLSGGALNAASETVGYAGTGLFNQSGGTNASAGTLTVGQQYGPNSPGTGTYNLTGGTLTTGNTVVGQGEQGTFVLNDNDAAGTTHTVNGNLILGDNGLLQNPGDPTIAGNGTYTITGNTFLNVNFANAGTGMGNGTGNSNGGTNTANANGALIVGEYGTGTFVQGTLHGTDSPTVTVAGDLSVGHQGLAGSPDSVADSSGSYTINTGSLTVGGSIGVGGASTGITGPGNIFTQNGGMVTVTGSARFNTDYVGVGTNDHIGELFIGGAAGSDNDGGTGTYNMNGGTLTVGLIEDGHSGLGTMNQIGGTVNASLWLGNAGGSSGTYNLSGGALKGGSEEIGLGGGGTNTFTQTGGTNTTGSLTIGDLYGTTGIYNLSGDPATVQLNVTGGMTVGATGQGTFNQSGGTVTAASLTMGTTGTIPNGSGIYNLSGNGQLSVSGDETIGQFGYGEFNQGNNSSNTVGGSLYLASLDNIHPNTGFHPREGVYTLTGGTLSTTNTFVGELGLGIFNQSGGTHTITNQLVIGDQAIPSDPTACGGTCTAGGPSQGTYNMNAGSLTADSVVVGNFGLGAFNVLGNSNVTTNGVIIAQSLGSAGSSMAIGNGLDSPTVQIDGYLTVGAGDAGSLNINSGSLTVGALTFVGGSPDGVGTVTQTGGTFETGGLLIGTITDSLTQTGHPNQSYAISGGSLAVDGTLVIGSGSQGGTFSEGSGGTMTQSGGSSVTVGAGYINNGTYNLQGGTFKSNDLLYVGDTKTGAVFNQTGGAATVTNDLRIGGTYAPAQNTIAGTYNLSGGNLTVGGNIIVGVNALGDGTFNYNVNNGNSASLIFSGGGQQLVVGDAGKGVFNEGSAGNTTDLDLNTPGVTLVIGRSVGGNGTFNLAAGSSLEDDLVVGEAGTGTFNNAGGTHNVTGNLILGDQATGNGTYNLTAGGVTTVTPTGSDGFTFVGSAGTGTFLVDNATLNTHDLVLGRAGGSTGLFTLQNGGSVNVGTVANTGFLDVGEHGTGTYNQTGGTTTVIGALDIGRCGSAAGCLGVSDTDTGAGNSTFNLSGGSLSVSQFAVVGDSGTGTLKQSGGSTVTIGGELDIGRSGGTGTYNLGDTASLTVGSNATGGSIVLGNPGGSGTFNLSGSGSVTVTAGTDAQSGTIFDGTAGTGLFTQSGTSTVLATNVSIGNNTGGIGTYTLSGGTLTLSNELFVGGGGQGTFTQSDASSIVTTAFLSVGNNAGGVGNYNLSAGSLTAFADTFLGGDNLAHGTITQTGGTAALDGNVNVGYATGATGIYTLGGSGKATIGGNLDIGVAANSTGTFNFNTAPGDAATLAFATPGSTMTVGDAGTGTFAQGGGDLNLAAEGVTLDIGAQKGSSGQYNLSGGSLEDGLIVGDAGTGVFNNTGGSHSVSGDEVLGNQSTGNGTYNNNGGDNTINGNLVVGAAGTGIYNLGNGTTGATLEVNGTGLSGGNLYVGVTGTGTLTASDASTATVAGVLTLGGPSPGDTASNGTLTVTGSGTKFTVDGQTQIGGAGTGILNVLKGGYLESQHSGSLSGTSGAIGAAAGSQGTVTVDGTGSEWNNTGELRVGSSGTGSLTISNGGLVIDNAGTDGTAASIGSASGSVGSVALGAGTWTNNGNVSVGDAGAGTYTQTGGTASVTGAMTLGKSVTGTGSVEVSGGTLSLGSLVVDAANTSAATSSFTVDGGVVSVTGGVTVNASGTPNGSSLTVSSGSLSAATVTNNDTLNITGGTVTAAVTNNHQFNFQGGKVAGSVTNNGTTNTSSSGTATVTGTYTNTSTGTTNVTGNSTLKAGSVSNAGKVTVAGGSTTLDAGSGYTQTGGTTTVDGLIKATLAEIDAGTIEGTGTVGGDLSNVGGTVRPGDAPGTMTVTGNYSQGAGGTFEAGIAGTDASQISKLVVDGTASLSGTLDIDLLDPFQAANGDIFNIMSFTSSTGDFTNFELDGNACTAGGTDIYNCSGLGAGLFFEEEFVIGDTGLDVLVEQTVVTPPSDVPEPWTVELFGVGLAGLAGMRRRLKAKKS
jgi:fibronectin-binding autotransporter adhesin